MPQPLAMLELHNLDSQRHKFETCNSNNKLARRQSQKRSSKTAGASRPALLDGLFRSMSRGIAFEENSQCLLPGLLPLEQSSPSGFFPCLLAQFQRGTTCIAMLMIIGVLPAGPLFRLVSDPVA